MHLRWRVRNQEGRTSRSGDPRIQAALLRQAALYCSGQKTSLATRGTAMMIRKINYNTQPGRRKEQRSSDSTEENGNHTEETQHGPSQSPPNIGVRQESGKKLNKRIRWSREEMKKVLWYFTCIKEKTLRENHKEVYKLWRERNTVTRMNVDAKALLNQKNYILEAQRIKTVEIDEIKENIRLKIGDERRLHKQGEWRQNGYKCCRAPEERPRKRKY